MLVWKSESVDCWSQPRWANIIGPMCYKLHMLKLPGLLKIRKGRQLITGIFAPRKSTKYLLQTSLPLALYLPIKKKIDPSTLAAVWHQQKKKPMHTDIFFYILFPFCLILSNKSNKPPLHLFSSFAGLVSSFFTSSGFSGTFSETFFSRSKQFRKFNTVKNLLKTDLLIIVSLYFPPSTYSSIYSY